MNENLAPIYRCVLKMGMNINSVSTYILSSDHKIINVEFARLKNGAIYTHFIHLPQTEK